MNSASAPYLADASCASEKFRAPGNPAASSKPKWPVAILGVPFDPVTIAEAVGRIEAMIASRRPHYVVTANVDFLVQAHRDVELRRILLDADLVLCDGTPLVWASRWLGNALPERVAGSDLAPKLMQTAAEKGYRVFFLGAAPGVAAEAAARLKERWPALNIVGHYAPPFASLLEMDHAQIAQRVRAAKPDILLVSFGCPKQEKWIAMHHRSLGVPVAIGVGATIDFLAGRMKRAPEWMQRSGAEWIFRLCQEPRRLFRRYANDLARFVPTFAAQWWRLTSHRPAIRQPETLASSHREWSEIDAGEGLTRESLERDAEFWTPLLQRSTHCLLNVSKIRHIDGTGIAFLVQWRKLLQTRARQLVLLGPSRALRRSLVATRLNDHFIVANTLAEAQHAEAMVAQPPVQRDGMTRSLAWCGEIIAANVNDVWQMTTDHVRTFVANDATLILIDLTRLRFIDSSGAALMLRLKQWAQELRIEIMFTHPQPNVKNVLRLTQLDQLLLEGAQ